MVRGMIRGAVAWPVVGMLALVAAITGQPSHVGGAGSMMGPMMTTNLSGPQLFALACASCHGLSGKGRVFTADGQTIKVPGITYASLSKLYTTNFDQQLRTAIVKGLDEEGKPLNPMMPRWTMLSSADVDKLVAYIKTLK